MHARYAHLAPYTPGEQPRDRRYVKLNTNESPFPPAPGVIDAVSGEAAAQLRLYSDPESRALKQALAKAYNVTEQNVFTGNGSDECLNFAFMAYGESGIAFPDVSYGFYAVYAALHGVRADVKALRDDWTVDTGAYGGIGKTIVLANPNAPTGLALSSGEIEALVAANRSNVVVIDEAYVDFGAESVVPLTKQYDNLLVVQTFSKSRQLAGARVGFAIGHEALIRDLETLKFSTNPYNINRLSEACGVAAVNDTAYFDETRRKIIENRAYTAGELTARGFTFPDSKANFIFAKKEGLSGEALYLALKEKGILVRHLSGARTADYNRITIGTREDMDALFAALDEILT